MQNTFRPFIYILVSYKNLKNAKKPRISGIENILSKCENKYLVSILTTMPQRVKTV